MSSKFNLGICFCLSLLFSRTALPQELIAAPDGYVRYKLSNLRVEQSILGEVVAIDYKRTSDGTGQHNVQLAARTDNGRLGIMGVSTIDESGTIRLESRFPGLARMLGGSERGMELYFVVNLRGTIGFYHPMTSQLLGGKEYLVSNVIRRGKMNSKVSARPLNKEEKAAVERERKARMPPEELPSGYSRGTANTQLVRGAPIKIGQGGQWQDAVVVDLPSATTVRAKAGTSPYLRKLNREDWIAVADSVAAKIRDNPDQFSTDLRTLPAGNLVLEDDMRPMADAAALVKGTPLLREQSTKWQEVFFVSADNVSARVLVNQFNKLKIEIVPKDKLAIRTQTIAALESADAEQQFAVNVQGYEQKVAGLAGFPGGSQPPSAAPTAPTGSFSGGIVGSPAEVNAEVAPAGNTVRTWSDSTGRFKVEAQLVDRDDQNVTLKRSNGKIAKVPLSKLSEPDLAYLKKLDEESENPFAALVDNEPLPMSSGTPATPSKLSPWDYKTPLKVISKVTDLGWGPKSIAISPDNKYLVIGRGGSEVSMCDLKSGQILMSSGRMDHMGDVTATRYTPDGKFLVLGGAKGTIEVYAVHARGKLDLKAQFAAHTKSVACIAFSSDGKYALTGGEDKEARYWEVATGRQIASVNGFEGKVKATCIRASDNELLATDGKTLKIFDLAADKVTRTMEVGRSVHTQGMAISPNGLLLAFNDGYKIVLWNLESYLQMPTIQGTDIPWIMAFGPDSRYIFSGHNGVMNIWDAKDQSRVISCPIGSHYNVQALGVSHDGSTVACGSAFAEVTALKAASAR
ncbi:MAG: hypothetical protein Aurels2KO_07590 [Aureliella sp.]